MARIAPINETKIVDATSIIKDSTIKSNLNLQDLDVHSDYRPHIELLYSGWPIM